MWEEKKRKLIIILYGVAALCTVVGLMKSIFVSLDIDESYAVAQAYRLAKGDRLLQTMWEPHQFSAIMIAWFIRLYLKAFQNADYLVITLRILGILMHLGIGFLLFGILRKLERIPSLLTASLFFLHLNFLPKWVQLPEFELGHYWGLCLMAACMLSYFGLECQKGWVPFLSGGGLILCMLCYPTMILLYPGYLAGWIILERKIKGAACMTGGCFAFGGIFLLYLFQGQSLEEFFTNLSYVFLDKSHTTYTMGQKWALYLKQLWGQFLIYLAVFGICLMLMTICRLVLKDFFSKMTREGFLISNCLLVAIVLHGMYLVGVLLQDQNQFYLQMRYVAIILPACYLTCRYHEKYALYLHAFLIPSILSCLAVLLITNMDTNTTYAKMFVGVLGSLIVYALYLREKMQKKILLPVLTVAILSGLFVCRILLIRVTGCLPLTINARMEKMTSGAQKGIYVLEDLAQIWNQNYSLLDEWIKEGDQLLYIGAENLTYVKAGVTLATPSTQGTNVYDENFLSYYSVHPEKLPNVILIDKTFETNDAYGNYFGWEPMMEWIASNYANADRMETDHMIFIRQK